MYVRLLFATTSILSVILSAWAADLDFTLPLDDLQQTDLFSIPSDPPLDPTMSLFDADIASSQTFDGADLLLLGQTDPNPSELSWDDPFQLADCSSSEGPFFPTIGKSRVRRIDDDSSGCTNPDAGASGANPSEGSMRIFLEEQTFNEAKHSITCFEATGGLLPFAVIPSPEKNDRREDTSKFFLLPFPFYPNYLVTLYHVTPCKRRNPSLAFTLHYLSSFWSPPFSLLTRRFKLITDFDALVTGIVDFRIGTDEIFCCEFVQTYFLYAMGINCVGLWKRLLDLYRK